MPQSIDIYDTLTVNEYLSFFSKVSVTFYIKRWSIYKNK